jgi:NAD(P)-dependent dehydrogenase (short-subunit alcohol dehydrogenase family)
VVGGSSGLGRQTAAEVVEAGGSAVVIGLHDARVNDGGTELSQQGKADGIAADLTDRMEAERVRQQLADEHADATLFGKGRRLDSHEADSGHERQRR